jgi:hypothetical protein
MRNLNQVKNYICIMKILTLLQGQTEQSEHYNSPDNWVKAVRALESFV